MHAQFFASHWHKSCSTRPNHCLPTNQANIHLVTRLTSRSNHTYQVERHISSSYRPLNSRFYFGSETSNISIRASPFSMFQPFISLFIFSALHHTSYMLSFSTFHHTIGISFQYFFGVITVMSGCIIMVTALIQHFIIKKLTGNPQKLAIVGKGERG